MSALPVTTIRAVPDTPCPSLAFPPLRRGAARTLQFNIGRLCNQACRHCHVDSSPARSGPADNADPSTVDDVLELLRAAPNLSVLDLTGGAPELHPQFRRLVTTARGLGRRVFVRHNLTVQFEPGQNDLPAFFADQGVELFCSLPCYLEANVARQRGDGVFEKSLRALRRLNEHGFGMAPAPGQPSRELSLVYNPIGPSLPPEQQTLEQDYRRALREQHQIEFTRLLTITNQPIHRFRGDLERSGRLDAYFALLEGAFAHATLDALMCRTTLSVRWDGRLYDCDFNLVQGLPVAAAAPQTLRELLQRGLGSLDGAPVTTARHCFACTAGTGSSCGGAIVRPPA